MSLQVLQKPRKPQYSEHKVPTAKEKPSDSIPKQIPESDQNVWRHHPKCSERKVEWVERRQELAQPHPDNDYNIPDDIDAKTLEREFDQLCDDLEDFSLEGCFVSEEFGLDAGILDQRVQAAENDEKERLSLEKDVAGFINNLTHAFVSPDKDIAATHFTTCMEEFRRVAKALPKSEYAKSLIKKALDKLADHMDMPAIPGH